MSYINNMSVAKEKIESSVKEKLGLARKVSLVSEILICKAKPIIQEEYVGEYIQEENFEPERLIEKSLIERIDEVDETDEFTVEQRVKEVSDEIIENSAIYFNLADEVLKRDAGRCSGLDLEIEYPDYYHRIVDNYLEGRDDEGIIEGLNEYWTELINQGYLLD